jgi:hypothetical protein
VDAKINLLTALHGYARRQNENFTTVAFAHLLKLVCNTDADIASRIFTGLVKGHVSISAEDCSGMSISNHEKAVQGTPDLVIKAPRLAIVIEVKVGQRPSPDQLQRYKKYLTDTDASRKCLVLLTRDPVDNECRVLADEHIFWHEVGELIVKEINCDPNGIASYVSKQFLEFVKAEGMTMDRVTNALVGGLQSLWSLRTMLREALGHCGFSPRKNQFLQEEDRYAGFYFDRGSDLCAVGIYLNRPELLQFEVHQGRLPPWKWKSAGELDFSSTGFFDVAVDKQRERIQQFIRENCDSIVERS